MQRASNHLVRRSIALCALALLVLAAAALPASAQAPRFVGAAFYGGAGDQSGFSIAANAGGVYLSGYAADTYSLALKYPLTTGTAPLWATAWPSAARSPRHEGLFGVSLTSEGAYYAGWSYSQTTDAIGDKEGKSVLVKFPLSGPTGPDVGGALWVAKPQLFPSYQGYELFTATTSTMEGSSPYLYASGLAEPTWGGYSSTLLKYDSAGHLLWSRILSEKGYRKYSVGMGITSLKGNLYVAGHYEASPAASVATLWKYDSAGNQLWSRTYQRAGVEVRARAVAASDNAIFVAGFLNAGLSGRSDALILKYDEAGNLLWEQTWGGASDDIAWGVAVIGSRVYVVGETASFGSGGKDAFLLELDAATGRGLSSALYGGARDDTARGVAAYGSDLYIVGESRSFASTAGNNVGEADIMLLHYTAATAKLISITLQPSTVVGGKPAVGKVTVSAPAAADTPIVLASENPAATVPPTVTIPAGQASATFPITTKAVTSSTTGLIKATLGSVTKAAWLTVRPLGIKALALIPSSVIGGNNAACVITMEGPAAPGDITVTLSSGNPAVAKPLVASVTIPAGKTAVAFTIKTEYVASTTGVTLWATANGLTKSATLSVRPVGVQSLALVPNSVTGGEDSIGVVVLDSKAGPGGVTVTLGSSDPGVASPIVGTLWIQEGSSVGYFTLLTSPVSADTTVAISVGTVAGSRIANLTVNR